MSSRFIISRSQFVQTLILVIPLSSAPVAAEIFRCKDPTGGITFTDHGCTTAEQTDVLEMARINQVQGLALSAAEQRQLQALRRRLEHATKRQSRRDEAHAEQTTIARSEAAERCHKATRQLDELLVKRRAGYRLKQDKALRLRQARLKEDKLRYC